MFNINGITWNVRLVNAYSSMLLDQNYNLFTLGACDVKTKTIYIADDLDDYMTWKVLCHEIVHAIIFSYGIQLESLEEEIVADIIATHGEEIIELTNKIFGKTKKGDSLT